MTITYSLHARERMDERNVYEEDVEHVLAGRGREHPSPRKRTQWGRSLGGRPLGIVYTEGEADRFHVVTVKTRDRR